MAEQINAFGETREQFTERLQREGRFRAFVRAREAYKGAGSDPSIAWYEASKAFAPVDPNAPPPELPVPILDVVAPVTKGDVRRYEAEIEGRQEAEVAEAEAQEQAAAEAEDSSEQEWWAKLNDAAVGRKAAELDAIRWVCENMQTPLRVLHRKRAEIPNRTAVNWLKWVRSSPANESKFWESTAPKLLPDKRTLEAEARFQDDGREVLEAIEKVRASRQETTT